MFAILFGGFFFFSSSLRFLAFLVRAIMTSEWSKLLFYRELKEVPAASERGWANKPDERASR